MVLVHGLLVILSSRRFSSVEVGWWVGPCTMGESRLTSWIEISRQVSRRLGNRHGKKQRYSPKKKPRSSLISPWDQPVRFTDERAAAAASIEEEAAAAAAATY